MQVFDHIDPQKLERRDAELWIMAITMIGILAVGMALLMYFSSLWNPVLPKGVSLREITLSFCTLSLLLVAYLVERQLTVRRLRKQLREERTRTARLLGQASADLLETLPDLEQFRTRLSLEFSSAETFQQPLSLVLTHLRPSRQVIESDETLTVIADAVKATFRMLRREDMVYLLAQGVFGILLPGLLEEDADRVAERLRERLLDASGANNRFAFNVHLINYPRHVASISEINNFIESCGAEAGPDK
ncbi:MAG: GGDEF domain-containing protein [Terriglobia bacterium]